MRSSVLFVTSFFASLGRRKAASGGIWRVFAALIAALTSFGMTSPASAEVVTIMGSGVATGTVTWYSCLNGPSDCGSETAPWNDQIGFRMDVGINGSGGQGCMAALFSPVVFQSVCPLATGVPQQVFIIPPDLTGGNQGWGFKITYLGDDPYGNHLFQGTDYFNFLIHRCGLLSECPGESYRAQADTFAVATVPEVSTWAMMLLGFGSIGMALRRKGRGSGALMQVA